MTEWLERLHGVNRAVHIGVGVLSVVLFWVALAAKKGGRLHVASGRAFFSAAVVAGLTALVGATWAVCAPVSFGGLEAGTAEERASASASLRFIFSLMIYLSLGVLSAALYGVRLARTKSAHARLASPLLRALLYSFGVASVGLIAFGTTHLASSGAPMYLVHVALGSLGVYGVRGDLRSLREVPGHPHAWVAAHVEHMVSAGIGLHMGFVLFGLNALVGEAVPIGTRALLALLPAAVGYSVMSAKVARLRPEYEE